MTPADASRRLDGIDVARALAIVGMLLIHVGPSGIEDLPGRLYALSHGRAAVLFLLIAGVGVSLLARSRTVAALPGGLATQLAWRAALLLLMGLWLQAEVPGLHIILQTYGMLYLLALVSVRLPGRWLLAVTAGCAIVGPLTFLIGRVHAPQVFNRSHVAFGDPPLEVVQALVLAGPYPLLNAAVPFLLGLWLGRLDLRAGAVRLRMLSAGAATMLAGLVATPLLHARFGEPWSFADWHYVLAAEPHSQMPLWLYPATATAVLVLVLCLWLADLAGRWLYPLSALGRVALTFYVGHALALNQWPDLLLSDQPAAALGISAAITAVAMLAAMIWLRLVPRGPLEALLQAPAALLPGWAGRLRSSRGASRSSV